jgi:cytochrome c oxidase subunit 2
VKKNTFSNLSSRVRRLSLAVGLGLAGLSLAACAAGAPATFDPHSPEAARINNLSWILFAIAGCVCLLVITLILIAAFRPHPNGITADLGPGPVPAHPLWFQGRVWIVGGGIVFPLVVLSAVFAIGLGVLNATPTSAGANDLTIQVIGHQWWWEVRYPQQGLTTANEIHIPTGQTVDLELTTVDVIHSFWVPQVAPKLDLINGVTNTLVLSGVAAGEYRGQCAEFCGLDHALMSMLIVAEPPAAFDTWVAGQRQPAATPSDPLAAQGQQVFLSQQCVYCHTVRGTPANGQIGPDLTHLASRQTLAAVTMLNTAGNLGGWVIDPQGVKPGNKMPHTDLTSAQLQVLLAYLESLK